MTQASADAAVSPRRANICGLIACQGDSPGEYFADGIHLTQAGNVWVAEGFAAAIEARR